MSTPRNIRIDDKRNVFATTWPLPEAQAWITRQVEIYAAEVSRPADVHADADALLELFDGYARASGLQLNLRKTVLIPLDPYDESSTRAEVTREAPGWSGVGGAWRGGSGLGSLPSLSSAARRH